MDNLNLINILYLFFRLAPFVLVCFFVIDSVINSNIRGLVLLTGLLVACFLATIAGGSIGWAFEPPPDVDPLQKYNCNTLTLGADGPISKLPLSQTTFGYIIAYLTAIMAHLNIAFSNIHVIILLLILIVADLVWNKINNCVNSGASILALTIGITVGASISTLIISCGYKDLYYIAGVSDNLVCSAPTTSKFVCTPN